jgi:hypothetical protein
VDTAPLAIWQRETDVLLGAGVSRLDVASDFLDGRQQARNTLSMQCWRWKSIGSIQP